TNRCLSKKPSMGWVGSERSGRSGWKSTLRFRVARAAMAPVRADDGLDEFVTDDVALGEMTESDALDRLERLHGLDEPRAAVARQVDLRVVAGDDRLRLRAEAREEHEHLLRGRVLRLVEDDKGTVKRAAAHVGEGSDLDHAALHEPRQ